MRISLKKIFDIGPVLCENNHRCQKIFTFILSCRIYESFREDKIHNKNIALIKTVLICSKQDDVKDRKRDYVTKNVKLSD